MFSLAALESLATQMVEKFCNDKHQKRADFVDQTILKVDQNAQNDLQFGSASFFERTLSQSQGKDQDFIHLKTEEEKIKLVKEMLDWSFPAFKRPEVLKKYAKNSEHSKLIRDHGNSLFRQRNLRDALHYFNIALLFGVDESLGLAYANRAAVLMELGDPAGALEDIDLAFKHNYPASRTQKLEERKLKCVQMMEKRALENAQFKQLIDKERAELNKVQDSISRIEKRNPRAPAAAEFVEVKFDETYGRQLVVARDVDAGTVLLVEDPYVCILEGQLNWNTEHCHHCFKRIRRGVPCEKCVFAFYCNEACLKASLESTHRFECILLPYLHLNHYADHVLEALRVICKVGSSELYRLFSTRDPNFFSRKQAFGAAPEDGYESDSYLSLFHLQSHPERSPFLVLSTLVVQALMMTEYLDAETEFFVSVPETQKKEFKDFVAAMMVRHVERRMVNQVALNEYDKLDDLTLDTVLQLRMAEPEKLHARLSSDQFKSKEFASGVYPLFSLLNHSCDPNAFYLNHGMNGTITVIATQRIKKGEQILIPYVGTYYYEARNVRKSKLLHYNFNCNCIACRNNWPTADGLIAPRPRYCCPACSKTFSQAEKDSSEFLKCELAGPSGMCGRCGQPYKFEELEKRCLVNMKLSIEAADLLYRGQPLEALRITLKVLNYFQTNLIPPEGQVGALLDYWFRSLRLILHLAQQ